MQARVDDAQGHHAEADEREGEEGADAAKFADKADRGEAGGDHDAHAGHQRDAGGRTELRVHLAERDRQKAVLGHREEDAGLAEHQDEDDRAQAEDGAELDERGEPGEAHGVDALGDRLGDVELVVGDDAGEHVSHEDVEHRADGEGAEHADRHVALRVLGFLRGGRDGVEADVGEEDHARGADDAVPAELALAQVRRDEEALRVAGGDPVGMEDVAEAERDEEHDDGHLEHDEGRVDLGRGFDADDEQGGDDRDDEHRRQVDHGAGADEVVDVGDLVRDPVERSGRISLGDPDAEAFKEALEVAGPADRDGHGADAVLEDEIPADDPGHQFAERGVGVGVGAAGDGHRGGHLGVAEAGEGAGDRADDEGKDDRRAGVRGGGVAGEDEDAGSDDAADADHHEVRGGEGALQRPFARRGGFVLEGCDAFAGEQAHGQFLREWAGECNAGTQSK